MVRISVPRAERIARAVATLAPRPTTSILDVGCGDGMLGERVAQRLGVLDVRGVDIKAQPGCRIEVVQYDGVFIPFPENRFDLVIISDVLHHAADQLAVMREAMRVTKPTGAVVVKDHFRESWWSHGVLLAMDVIGNYAQGIVVTGKYLSRREWDNLFSRVGGRIDTLVWPFEVHTLPFRLIARSRYQFVARVVRDTGERLPPALSA